MHEPDGSDAISQHGGRWDNRGTKGVFVKCGLLGGSSQDLDTWLITMVIVSPLSGVMGPPSKWPNFMAYKWG